jgi:acyl-CoA hydrolase
MNRKIAIISDIHGNSHALKSVLEDIEYNKQVAINSAIEVDLTGQVCADSIGPTFFSGTGGQLDFMYGALRSPGGVPIIALPATAKDGTVSRIVPMLKQGAGVVTTRNHVRFVVTEYGAADLETGNGLFNDYFAIMPECSRNCIR